MSKQAKVNYQMLKLPWTANGINFVNRLIQRKVNRRLGQNGLEEIKAHPWMKDFPWKYLKNRIIRPEFVPKVHHNNFDYRNVNKKDNFLDPKIGKLLKKIEIQELFKKYCYRENNDFERNKELYTLTTKHSALD